jgi:ribonuclease HI
MNHNIMTDTFSYQNTNCIIICDGGLMSQNNISVVGWVIIDAKTSIPLAEGRAIISPSTTTTQSELFSVITALLDVQKMGYNNVIIKTDFDGFITHINQKNKKINEFEILNKILNTFNSWNIEKVDRNETSRPHNLASSIDLDVDYCPEIDTKYIRDTINKTT